MLNCNHKTQDLAIVVVVVVLVSSSSAAAAAVVSVIDYSHQCCMLNCNVKQAMRIGWQQQ